MSEFLIIWALTCLTIMTSTVIINYQNSEAPVELSMETTHGYPPAELERGYAHKSLQKVAIPVFLFASET